MRVIEPGEFVTSIIRCPYCKALLEIDKRDINYFLSKDTTYATYVKCEECESTVFVDKNGEEMKEKYIIAWMPLPEPYKAESSETKQGLAYVDQDTMMPAT